MGVAVFFFRMQGIFFLVNDVIDDIHTGGDKAKNEKCNDRLNQFGGNKEEIGKYKRCKDKYVFIPLADTNDIPDCPDFTCKIQTAFPILSDYILVFSVSL